MSIKPVYKYSEVEGSIKKGHRARIYTKDHLLFGTTWVSTSAVVKYDRKTKNIETLNSIYKYVAQDDQELIEALDARYGNPLAPDCKLIQAGIKRLRELTNG